MPDLPPGFMVLTDAEWQLWGDRGEAVAREAIARLALETTTPPTAVLAIAFGALVAAADFLRAMSGPEDLHKSEQWALATVRGVLRGAEGAVTDSGKPFLRASDG